MNSLSLILLLGIFLGTYTSLAQPFNSLPTVSGTTTVNNDDPNSLGNVVAGPTDGDQGDDDGSEDDGSGDDDSGDDGSGDDDGDDDEDGGFGDGLDIDDTQLLGAGLDLLGGGGPIVCDCDTQCDCAHHNCSSNNVGIKAPYIEFGDAYYEQSSGDQDYLNTCCYQHFTYDTFFKQWEWVLDGPVEISIEVDPNGDQRANDTDGNTYFYSNDGSGYCFCHDGNKWYYLSSTDTQKFYSEEADTTFARDGEGNAYFSHDGGSTLNYSKENDEVVFTTKNGDTLYYFSEFSWGNDLQAWYAEEPRVQPYLELKVGTY